MSHNQQLRGPGLEKMSHNDTEAQAWKKCLTMTHRKKPEENVSH